MAIVRVQKAPGTAANSSTAPVTLSPQPVAGNALIAITEVNSSNTVTGIAGGGVTWVKALAQAVTGRNVEIWYGLNASGSGGTTITVTFNNMASGAVEVAEYSGVKTASALLTSAAGSNASAQAGSTASVTTIAPSVILGGLGFSGAAPTGVTGPSNSFSELNQQSGANGSLFSVELIASTPGTYQSTYNWTSTAAATTAVTIALEGIATASLAPSTFVRQAVNRGASF